MVRIPVGQNLNHRTVEFSLLIRRCLLYVVYINALVLIYYNFYISNDNIKGVAGIADKY